MDQSLEREIRRLYSCFHSPRDPRGRSFVPLADAYRRAGDLQRARLLLEEGLRRHPGFSSAHVVAMRIARDVSDHPGTLAATRRVLELDPGNAEALRVLADIGPLAGDARNPEVAVSPDERDAGLPDESWMVGDAGVWGAGTDSGLASVDPEALEAEEKRAAALEAGRERPPAAPEAREEKRPAVPKAIEERPPAPDAEPQETGREAAQPVAPRAREAPPTDAPPRAIPARAPSTASGGAADAGIYTRTLGRLYEQQGFHAQAIAVYERLLDAEPGDGALAGRIERLRRQVRDEASGATPAASESDGGSRVAGSGPPEASAVGVVPIESLAPDAPAAGARGGAP